MGLYHSLLLLVGVLGDLLVGLAVGAVGFVLPQDPAESQPGGTAPVAVYAGEDEDGGEQLVGDVPQAVGGYAVGVDAAVADVLAVALDVDGVAGEVALADDAFYVLQEVFRNRRLSDF